MGFAELRKERHIHTCGRGGGAHTAGQSRASADQNPKKKQHKIKLHHVTQPKRK